MGLQPYSPVEEAIQKSIATKTLSPKISKDFWWGVLATILAGGAAWGIIVKIKRKKERINESETT